MASLQPALSPERSRASDASDLPLYLAWLAVLILSIAFFLANVWQGIGIYVDSTRYMGLSPFAYDAPVYHWMLVGGHALGFSFAAVATFLGAIFLVANVSLIFALIARATQGWAFAFAGTALIAFSPQFVTLHSGAISEPPFLLFALLTLWAILDYFESGKLRWLIVAAVVLAVGSLTRFTLPPLGAAIACVMLLDPKATLRQKARDIAILGGLSGFLFFTWVVISQLEVGRSIGRDLWFYGTMGAAEWRSSFEAVGAWVLPKPAPIPARLLIVLAVVCFAAWRWWLDLRSLRRQTSNGIADAAIALPLILAPFFVFYLAFVGLSVSIEANLSLNGRYAFPAYVILVMLVAIQASKLTRDVLAERLALYALAALAVVMWGSHLVRTSVRTIDVAREGYGFQSLQWRNSPTMAAIKALPADVRIYSNAPDVVAYLSGRKAEFIPHEKLLRTNMPEPGNSVEKQLRELGDQAASGEVAVAFFDAIDWRFYLASEQTIADGLPLELVGSFADGKLYRLIPAALSTEPIEGSPHD